MTSSSEPQRLAPDEGLVEVRRSPIHGHGVFARCDIPAGMRIGRYEGPRVAEDDVYVLWIDCEDEGLYGIDGCNDLRFVNHAARPNASFEGEELIAIAPIRSGEEITFHYGEEWEVPDEAAPLDETELDEALDLAHGGNLGQDPDRHAFC